MKLYKKIARKVVFPAMMRLGVDKIIRPKGAPKLLNIMYHGVVEKDRNYFLPVHLQKDQFEQHLKYYKKNFDIITVKEAFEIVKNKIPLLRNTLAISFDDGYKNNIDTALPLLEKHEVPATIFVSSLCFNDENNIIWSFYVAAINYFYKDIEIKIGNHSFINSYDSKNQTSLIDFIKFSECEERESVLKKLESDYHLKDKLNSIPSEIWKLMSTSDLIEVEKSSMVTIESHGHLHFNLGFITFESAVNDLKKSKDLLESNLKKEINLLAYPDGSYSDKIKDAAEELGFKSQYAVTYKEKSDANDSRIMNRHGISSGTTFESNMIFLNKAFKTKGISPT